MLAVREIVVERMQMFRNWLGSLKEAWTEYQMYRQSRGMTFIFYKFGLRKQRTYDHVKVRRNYINIILVHPYHNLYRMVHKTFSDCSLPAHGATTAEAIHRLLRKASASAHRSIFDRKVIGGTGYCSCVVDLTVYEVPAPTPSQQVVAASTTRPAVEPSTTAARPKKKKSAVCQIKTEPESLAATTVIKAPGKKRKLVTPATVMSEPPTATTTVSAPKKRRTKPRAAAAVGVVPASPPTVLALTILPVTADVEANMPLPSTSAEVDVPVQCTPPLDMTCYDPPATPRPISMAPRMAPVPTTPRRQCRTLLGGGHRLVYPVEPVWHLVNDDDFVASDTRDEVTEVVTWEDDLSHALGTECADPLAALVRHIDCEDESQIALISQVSVVASHFASQDFNLLLDMVQEADTDTATDQHWGDDTDDMISSAQPCKHNRQVHEAVHVQEPLLQLPLSPSPSGAAEDVDFSFLNAAARPNPTDVVCPTAEKQGPPEKTPEWRRNRLRLKKKPKSASTEATATHAAEPQASATTTPSLPVTEVLEKTAEYRRNRLRLKKKPKVGTKGTVQNVALPTLYTIEAGKHESHNGFL